MRPGYADQRASPAMGNVDARARYPSSTLSHGFSNVNDDRPNVRAASMASNHVDQQSDTVPGSASVGNGGGDFGSGWGCSEGISWCCGGE